MPHLSELLDQKTVFSTADSPTEKLVGEKLEGLLEKCRVGRSGRSAGDLTHFIHTFFIYRLINLLTADKRLY